MESYSETMRFVTNHLHQMQDGRMMVENHGVIFLSVDVDYFFALSNRSERLINDLKRFECLSRSMELSEAAVDQNQARHVLFLFTQALVTARNHFSHGGKIIDTFDGLDNKFPVVRFL